MKKESKNKKVNDINKNQNSKSKNNIFSPKTLLVGFVVLIFLLLIFNYFYSYKSSVYDKNSNLGELYSGILPPNNIITCIIGPPGTSDGYKFNSCDGYADGTVVCRRNSCSCGPFDFGVPDCFCYHDEVCINGESNKCPSGCDQEEDQCMRCGTKRVKTGSNSYKDVPTCVPNPGASCRKWFSIGTCNKNGDCV